MYRAQIYGYQVHGGVQGVIDGPLSDGYQDHGNTTNHGGDHHNSVVFKHNSVKVVSYYSYDNTYITEDFQNAVIMLLYAIQTHTI